MRAPVLPAIYVANPSSMADQLAGYGFDSNNIGNLKEYGIFGSMVFSPPYFNAIKRGDEGPYASNKRISYQERIERFQGYSTDSANIGNIPKFGSVIFIPPYFDALSITKGGGSKSSIQYEETTKELQMKRSGPFAVKKNLPTPYSSKDGNIGNISEFGSIIFSPPLGEANRGSGIARKGYEGKYGKDEKLKDRCNRPLSQDKSNISNICYNKTYLGEMFKVYSECFKVLKPGKFMVVVVKDIQRNWKTIPLGADAIKLCQLAGFDLHDIIINKMYFPSFWMLNLARKSQLEGNKGTRNFHVLKSHEYVLVFRKPTRYF